MTLPEFSQFIERKLNELESNGSLLTDAPLLQQITELRVGPNELKAAIALSDDAAELADYEKSLILQATCDGVERLNYEAESSHLSKLVTELESPVYSGVLPDWD